MNRIILQILIGFLFFNTSVFGQLKISVPKFNLSFNSIYDSTITSKINLFLNDSLEKIALVRIKPHLVKTNHIDPYNTNLKIIEKEDKIYHSIIKDDSIAFDMIEVYKILNDSNYNELISSLFIKNNPYTISASRCNYEPRNGIMILGKNDKFLGFIEICYKCDEHRNVKGLSSYIKIDSDKYETLEQLFRKYKISTE